MLTFYTAVGSPQFINVNRKQVLFHTAKRKECLSNLEKHALFLADYSFRLYFKEEISLEEKAERSATYPGADRL